jgi:hypothetical protein
MRYTGFGGLGNNQGGPHRAIPEPGARVTNQGITALRSDEGKAAKAFIDKINSFSFNEALFAEMVLALGGMALTPRIMRIVKALIRSLGGAYDDGNVNAETIEARRLMDTLDHYGM